MDPNAQAVADVRAVVSQFQNALHGNQPTVPGTATLMPAASPSVSPLVLYGGLALAALLLLRK